MPFIFNFEILDQNYIFNDNFVSVLKRTTHSITFKNSNLGRRKIGLSYIWSRCAVICLPTTVSVFSSHTTLYYVDLCLNLCSFLQSFHSNSSQKHSHNSHVTGRFRRLQTQWTTFSAVITALASSLWICPCIRTVLTSRMFSLLRVPKEL